MKKKSRIWVKTRAFQWSQFCHARGFFLDASPPDCAHISGPYERYSSSNICPLISVPSVWRGEILAPPRDNSYPKIGGSWGHLSISKILCRVQKEPVQPTSTRWYLVSNTRSFFGDHTLLHLIIDVKLGTQQSAAEILFNVCPCWRELGLCPVHSSIAPRKANLFFF